MPNLPKTDFIDRAAPRKYNPRVTWVTASCCSVVSLVTFIKVTASLRLLSVFSVSISRLAADRVPPYARSITGGRFLGAG
jgi:hypothetical protein